MQSESIHVLLVEDNPGDARLLKEYLNEASAYSTPRTDFEWITTDRLTQAVSLVDSRRFDVALLDLSLPDAHGLETFDRLQAHAPQIPIIVLSGLDDSTVAVEAVRKGAQDYLVKGDVNASLLLRSIRYAIERKRGEDNLKHVDFKMKEWEKRKGDFLSAVSNGFRDTINGIRNGVSQCLAGPTDALNENQRQRLHAVLERVGHLSRVVADLIGTPDGLAVDGESAHDSSPPSGPSSRLLVIDQEEKDAEIIRDFLTEDRYILMEARDGQNGIAKAIQERPSMILLDMGLTGMNAFEVLGRLQQDSRTCGIPVLGMIPFPAEKRNADSAAYSSIPVLNKPLQRAALREKIQGLLTVEGRTTEGEKPA